MKLYAVKKDELAKQEMEKMLELLENKRRQRVNQIRNREDRLRSIGAGLLLRYAYLQDKHTAEEWEKLVMSENKNGKPYIEVAGKEADFHFSLSHSADWIVCGTDTREIGIDIEEVKEYRERVAKRFFSQKENERLQRGTDKEKEKMFYQMWTAKESYVKMTGTGLTVPLSEIVCDVEQKCILDCKKSECIKIDYIENIERYMICVCAKDEKTKIPKCVEILTGQQLLEGCYAECKREKCSKKR